MPIPATPAKLKSGAWGARVRDAQVAVGDVVQITTSTGKTWQAKVTKIVWSGQGVVLCATASLDRDRSTARTDATGRDGGEYCGYPCPVSGRRCCPANGPCHDCA